MATTTKTAAAGIGELVPLTLVHQHPHNVRMDTVISDEMVASIARQGVLQPVTLVPVDTGWCQDGHEVCYWPIAGNRRTLAAVQAGVETVPAILRPDLQGDAAAQTEFMLIENLQRTDLTPVEEAMAYEQLTFAGVDVKMIAAATGRNAKTIRSRLKLSRLGTDQLGQLHAGQLTLGDAEVFLEFADDQTATDALAENAGTPDFQLTVNELRARRERMVRNQTLAAEYDQAGLTAVPVEGRDDVDWAYLTIAEWSGTPLASQAGHEGCAGYLALRAWDSYGQMDVVCVDRSRHQDVDAAHSAAAEAERADRQAREARRRDEQAAAQAEKERQRAEATALREVRLTWLTDYIEGHVFNSPRGPAVVGWADEFALAVVPLLARADGVLNWPTWADHADMIQVAADARPETHWQYEAPINQRADAIAAGTPAAARTMLARLLAGVIAFGMEVDAEELSSDTSSTSRVDRLVDLWTWLKGIGYPLTTPDEEQYGVLTDYQAELHEALDGGAA